MKEIARGAESVIYEDKDTIIKDRLKKTYRLKELDDELRKQRTRREARLLEKVSIPHPRLISSDDRQKIVMQKIHGEKLREVLDKKPELAKRVGELVAELHNHNIIHGDLTTSNMILRSKKSALFGTPADFTKSGKGMRLLALPESHMGLSERSERMSHSFVNLCDERFDDVVFIDFGLSFHSDKVEDKAVDIHLFKQALDSKHFKVYDKALKEFLTGYKKVNNHDAIMQRLKQVELRGRYKH